MKRNCTKMTLIHLHVIYLLMAILMNAYQASSAMAPRKLEVCTRCWRCHTRERTCPWWSFCLGRRCLWPPWSPSLKPRCWRSGPIMWNGRRWKSTYPGERWNGWIEPRGRFRQTVKGENWLSIMQTSQHEWKSVWFKWGAGVGLR